MASLVLVLGFVALALYLVHLYLRQQRIINSLKQIPGVKNYPIVGCMFELLKNLDRQPKWWFEKTKELGLVWYGWSIGQPPLVFVMEPSCVEHVLKSNFLNYPKGPNFYIRMKELLGDGIFNADGKLWKTQRQVASHMFKTSTMKTVMMTTFKEHGLMVLERLNRVISESKSRPQPKEIDVQDLYYRFTLDSIGVIAFGKNINSLEHDVPFSTAFDLAQSETERRFFSPFWKLRDESKLRDALKVLDAFAEQVIKERKQETDLEEKQDLLSRYIVAVDEDGQSYSDSYLRDTIMNFMIAGRDTTAQTLTWATYMLAMNPEKEQQMIAEIDATLKKDEVPTYDQLKAMKYVNAVISETLRLYPPVYGDPKESEEDDVLPNGMVIPKGTIVGWSAYVMGRWPDFWDSAEEFLPERWLNGDPKKYHPYQFIPFQAGPRTCLGQNMAYLEAGTLLCLMYQKYFFRLAPGHTVDFQRSLTLPAKDGMWMHVFERPKK